MTRDKIIVRTSILGVVANILIAAIKVIAGIAASSIAIISEGINNAADALTSVLTLVGTKLAARHPDAKHPFGYGRIEYLTALVIAAVILFSGFQMLIEAVKLIFKPEPLAISYVSLAVVAVSAVLKYVLGLYTMKKGKEATSEALVGVGADCKSDAYVSIITIISALVFIIFDVSIDAYAGVIMAGVILKAGYDVLTKTLADLIGKAGEKELAHKIYKMIRSTPGILGAADMMLHNYGPDAWSGSVNVEIDHEKTVGEIYDFLHALQLKIMREEHVTMVFGVYAVDNDHEETRHIRKTVAEFVRGEEFVKSFHAVYVEPETKKLYVDFIVDYQLRDWEALKAKFLSYMKTNFPENEVVLTIETEFV